MRILVIQHIRDSGPGQVGAGIRAAGLELEIFEGWRGESLDALGADFAGLLSLGGTQSAAPRDLDSPLSQELATMQRFHANGRPILGICLGGQLLARALGGKVMADRHGEFGFCRLIQHSPDSVLPTLPKGGRLMQWHDDCFVPPARAKRLFRSRDCAEQGFRLHNSIGLQFHPEVDRAILEDWLKVRAREFGDYRGAQRVRVQARTALGPATAFGFELGRRFAALIKNSS